MSSGNIKAIDYSVSLKTAYAAAATSLNSTSLTKLVFNNNTVTQTSIINDGIYKIEEIEVLEDGSLYFSGKRLSDDKFVLAKCSSTGSVTILGTFDKKIFHIEKTTEYIDRYYNL
ncbi:MAG: hypothetical protein U0U66_14775 [Cytophagaceae bacterium]